MELSNALKSLLATLTTKTTAIASDGLMLANIGDGTPNGKISVPNLKALIGGLRTDFNGSLADANKAPYGTVFFLGGSTVLNLPNGASFGILITVGDVKDWGQLYIGTYPVKHFIRTRGGSKYSPWKEISLDVPAFYNSYADLAALATGIMGQTISSITAQYFQGTIAQAVFDNVFIAVTRLSDTYPLAVKPKDWSSYNSASAYHVDGVLLVSGDKHLVIAPSEANLRWGADADSHAASGNTATSDRDAAMATFDGKARTNTAVQVSEYSSAEVAPGYCHAFTTVTSAYDTTKTAYARRKAGMWWLPSLGEMMMIWSNMTKINQVMSLIGGTPLSETVYWTSTEYSQDTAWYLNLSNGYVDGRNKKSAHRVRPVAAF